MDNDNKPQDWSTASPTHWQLKTGALINEQNRPVYLLVVLSLSIFSLVALIGIIWLAYLKIEIPQALIALGSVAVGALGSLFTHGK